MRSKLLIILLIVILGAGYFGYKTFTGQRKPTVSNITVSQVSAPNGINEEAQYLYNAFMRKRSLGFKASEISLNETETSLTQPPVLVEKRYIHKNWQLGNGQLVGASNIDFPDRAFYLVGVTNADCPAFVDVPKADITAWQQAFENSTAIFPQDQDIPRIGCFNAWYNEKETLIFYRLVYVTKSD